MENNELVLRYPDFYFDFHCIGPACSDNCCHSWPIEIDKAHYLRYRGQKQPEFAALCGSHLHRIKKDATDRAYARLSLKEDGRCGFQDEDGGCRIIRLLGEDWLSDTCCLYPRRKNMFLPGLYELSLAMSCEEMVRLGILRQEEITFVTEKRTFAPSDPLYLLPPEGKHRPGTGVGRYPAHRLHQADAAASAPSGRASCGIAFADAQAGPAPCRRTGGGGAG